MQYNNELNSLIIKSKDHELRVKSFFCTTTYGDLFLGTPESSPNLLLITHVENKISAMFKVPINFIEREYYLTSDKQLPDYFCSIYLISVIYDNEFNETIESAVICWFQREFPFNISQKINLFFENIDWDNIVKNKF
jgi:hypothetical protein